jgi:hypothetical protein
MRLRPMLDQHPQVISRLLQEDNARSPLVYGLPQVVADSNQQEPLCLRAHVLDGLQKVAFVHLAGSMPPIFSAPDAHREGRSSSRGS